ncbi:MAG: ABC transporter substrate-binding protein [Phycisphaerae bacterium]|nr:ABC transporter substrate-binding protein [Phycisphaerae bacterium]
MRTQVHRNIRFLSLLKMLPGVFLLVATLSCFPAAGDEPGKKYNEAPMLAKLVKAGKLPPVEKRLPSEPVVVKPVKSIGKYGGTWRRLIAKSGDVQLSGPLGYEPLVRWDRTGIKVVPGVAKSWEIRDKGKTYIFHLRKGMKWSDGQPFTSADIMFWYEDIICNKELTPIFPNQISPGGNQFVVSAPDKYTVVFKFKRPNGIFLETLAFVGQIAYAPRHYLKQFHIKYTKVEKLKELARKESKDLWYDLFHSKANLNDNPDLPTIRAWKLKIAPPETRVVAERNPYYWKVDPKGNQLPYIDRVAYTLIQNAEVLNLKAMSGEVDMQGRYIAVSKYALFQKNRKKGKYRVLVNPATGSSCIYLNQHSKDPAMRALLQNRKFRVALAAAINRKELIEFIFSGLATPTNSVSNPIDPFYLPEFGKKNIKYDPKLANKLLDELGMKRDKSGMRRMPNGKPFRKILNLYGSRITATSEMYQLVVDYWREVGLEFVVKQDANTLSLLQVKNGNSDFWAYSIAGLHWIVDPIWYVPLAPRSYHAPLYGRYISSGGKSGVKPSKEFQQIIDWYGELAQTCGNEPRKLELGRNILAQWAEQCYIIGIARPTTITIVSNRFKNMPDKIICSYRVMAPGYIGVEQFYIDEK